MLRVKEQTLNTYGKLYSARCPNCDKKLRFYEDFCPPICRFCKEELPNFFELLEERNERINYYFLGF